MHNLSVVEALAIEIAIYNSKLLDVIYVIYFKRIYLKPFGDIFCFGVENSSQWAKCSQFFILLILYILLLVEYIKIEYRFYISGNEKMLVTSNSVYNKD